MVNSRIVGATLVMVLVWLGLRPIAAAAQPGWRALTVQPEVAYGSGGFGAMGLVVAAEAGVASRLRVYAQYTNRQAFAGCYVSEGASECNASPRTYETGVRWGLGAGTKVMPFAGVGAGVYRRTPPGTNRDESALLVSAGFGMDVRLVDSLVVRFSLDYDEVVDGALRDQYGGVRYFGLGLGLGVVVW